MGKLYPPVIEGTLPAFYSENGIVKITIPFSMNRAVSYSQIGGFELKIKTIQNGTYLYTVRTYNPTLYNVEGPNLYVTFLLKDEDNKLRVGQFYKLQMAYIYVDEATKLHTLSYYYKGLITLEELEVRLSHSQEVGFFSDISVVKYTTKPNIYINNLRKGFLNAYTNSYTGYYEQIDEGDDQTERVHSYRFDVFNDNGEIQWTSGDCIHNASLDNNIGLSQDIYYLNKDVDYDKIYYIQYTITTTNNLTLSTPKYKLIYRELIDSELAVDLHAKLNFDNGYIDIIARNKTDDYGLPSPITGAFVLLRSDEDSEFNDWDELLRFKLANEILDNNSILFRDYTTVQGKHYIYAIQQYNDNNLYSNKICSNKILADFEDAFLYDGKKQLKIKYNPKVSKFTDTRLEQKVDTIGSKYPFIFRNGHVAYHQFPISGLISYFMDEEHLFLPEKELLTQEKTINYTTENVAQERLFKIRVLEWLNDGKPKLFRSPEEGNFIVRILKVSLTPQDKLGRLLHTFNGTAYEIADCTYENLHKLHFIDASEPDDKIMNWGTVDLQNYTAGGILNTNSSEVYSIEFTQMTPGEIILLTYTDDTQEEIMIGATGNYYLHSERPIRSIVIPKRFVEVPIPIKAEYEDDKYFIRSGDSYVSALNNIKGSFNVVEFYNQGHSGTIYYRQINEKMTGLVNYGYYITRGNEFGAIDNVTVGDCTIQQFIGAHDILKEISSIKLGNDNYLVNPKEKVIKYYNIVLRQRPIEQFDKIDGTLLILQGSKVNYFKKHPFTLYFNTSKDEDNTQPYYDFIVEDMSDRTITYPAYEPYIILNGEKIYITHEQTIDLKQFDKIKELKIGNGVVAELMYQTRIIEFKVENTNQDLIKARKTYLDSIDTYRNYFNQEPDKIDQTTVRQYRAIIINNYKKYIELLSNYVT